MFRKFLQDRGGNFAIMTAIATIPLLLSVGLYVDYARQSSARSHLQALADGGALQLAGSRLTNEARLRALAMDNIAANADPSTIKDVQIVKINQVSEKIELQLRGKIDTTFMRFGNIFEVGVQAAATAERGTNGQLEIALVLDNTYSMSEGDGRGGTKMSALKTAATELVTNLLRDSRGKVKIGVVPYADYVNVGTSNRGASWLSVPADYEVSSGPRTCETRTTQNVCTAYYPTTSCTRIVDGVEEPATCGGGCQTWSTVSVTPFLYCTGGTVTQYKWHGCVGSRMVGDTRLDDKSPMVPYPGYVNWVQLCPTPITPLTTNQSTVLTAIDQMQTSGPYYQPSTYIPAGLIWGQNVLSPQAPFREGASYDSRNVAPRKVAVLMTDGDNTLRFNVNDGTHIGFDSGRETYQRSLTDADTAAICTYMKSRKVEIYSVAFMVDNAQARTLLENCATDSQHYFDASDAGTLISAFKTIADSLSMLRLVK